MIISEGVIGVLMSYVTLAVAVVLLAADLWILLVKRPRDRGVTTLLLMLLVVLLMYFLFALWAILAAGGSRPPADPAPLPQ